MELFKILASKKCLRFLYIVESVRHLRRGCHVLILSHHPSRFSTKYLCRQSTSCGTRAPPTTIIVVIVVQYFTSRMPMVLMQLHFHKQTVKIVDQDSRTVLNKYYLHIHMFEYSEAEKEDYMNKRSRENFHLKYHI